MVWWNVIRELQTFVLTPFRRNNVFQFDNIRVVERLQELNFSDGKMGKLDKTLQLFTTVNIIAIGVPQLSLFEISAVLGQQFGYDLVCHAP